MKVLITSGGTTIPIDLVRKITNMSRGTFGSQICESFVNDYKHKGEFADRELDITFMSNIRGRLPHNSNINASDVKLKVGQQTIIKPYYNLTLRCVGFDTYDQYKNILFQLLDSIQYDIIILAAAVSDYGVSEENFFNGKIRSTEDQMTIKLVKLPKLISYVREKQPTATIVGFKLMVNSTKDELKKNCIESIQTNKIDMIVGNDLRDIKNDNHTLMVGTQYLGCNFNTPNRICFETYSKQEAIQDHQTLSDYLVDVIYEVFYVKNNYQFYPNFEQDCVQDCGSLEIKNDIKWCKTKNDFCQSDVCPAYQSLINQYKKQFVKQK